MRMKTLVAMINQIMINITVIIEFCVIEIALLCNITVDSRNLMTRRI